jgi:DNA repair protein RadC
MEHDSQYAEDVNRLSNLIEKHTAIPKMQVREFIEEYGVSQILPCANILCKTSTQRKKLEALFEFKNLFDIAKSGEKNNEYNLSGTESARQYFRNFFADVRDKEHFAVAYLNSNLDLLTTKVITSGTLNGACVYPREIIKEALFCNANSIIVAHNHPSGSTTLTQADVFSTAQLKKGLEAADIHLIDHIIVAGDKTVSMAESGHLSHNNEIPDTLKAASSLSEKSGTYSLSAKRPSVKKQLMNTKAQRTSGLISDTQKSNNHYKNAR